MLSSRIRQVNDLLRVDFASAIQRLVELPPGVVVSVTRVHTTADLHHATIFISILPDHQSGSTLRLIKQHFRDIISSVVDQLSLHHIPHFHLKLDDTERLAARLDSLLDSLHDQ